MSIELLARCLFYLASPVTAPKVFGVEEGEDEPLSEKELAAGKRESAYLQTKNALMTTTSLIFRNFFDRNAYHAPEPEPFTGADMNPAPLNGSLVEARVGNPDPFHY